MEMRDNGALVVAQCLEDMGMDIVRGGFAVWLRDELGYAPGADQIDRALTSVGRAVARGAPTLQEAASCITAEMPSPPGSRIDAFGGSAWTFEEAPAKRSKHDHDR